MDPDNLSRDTERLLLELLRHNRLHAGPRAPEQIPAAWTPPPYQRGPAHPPRRAPVYNHHNQPSAPLSPVGYMTNSPAWDTALQPVFDRVWRDAAAQANSHRAVLLGGPSPACPYGPVPIAAAWPGNGPIEGFHTAHLHASNTRSNWSGQTVSGSETPVSSLSSAGSSGHRSPTSGRSTWPSTPEPASPGHRSPGRGGSGAQADQGSVSSASTATSTASHSTRRSTRGATMAPATPPDAPLSSQPFPHDYSLHGPDGAGEPTRCVVSLIVGSRVDKYIYISPSVCPSCSSRDDDDDDDDDNDKNNNSRARGRYCANDRRRGSFTSTAAISNGVAPGHRCIRLAARTGASDEGLDVFLRLLHAPDPSSAAARLPPLASPGAHVLAHVAMADAQFGAAGRHRASLAVWAARWADALERRVLRADGGLARLARAPAGRLAALLYAAGRLRLPDLWRLATRAAVLHCPVDADGAVCAPCGGGGGGGDGEGEPYRLFRLVPDRGMEDAARGYCAIVREARRQVLGDIIDAIYDTRETIRRKKTGYGQRDPLKAQMACLGLWPGHHAADYRSHPAVRESVVALMGRVKRAADAAGARGDNADLLVLVDRIRAIVDAVRLPLP